MGRLGVSGVALLPWSAPIDHVEGTPSGRRGNVGGTSSGGPADVPIGVPPAWGILITREAVQAVLVVWIETGR